MVCWLRLWRLRPVGFSIFIGRSGSYFLYMKIKDFAITCMEPLYSLHEHGPHEVLCETLRQAN